jgi:hypothetical protein
MMARRPTRPVRAALVLVIIGLAFVAAGCGEEEETVSYSDDKIVETLDLQKADGGYAIGGDPFCAVESNLLNDGDEVSKAQDRDDLGLVISSNTGNVGIRAVPPFAPDCEKQVQKRLDELDPKPKKND